MELWELIARESIRDLTARYNANGDAGRIDQVVELFAEDAVLEITRAQTCRGRDEIRAFFDSVVRGDGGRKKIRVLRHLIATHQIDLVDEGEAHGRCYFAVLTEDGLDHWGRYRDRYRCIDGRWLFQERTVTLDGAIEGGWAGTDLASSRE
jgi:hypothetical protein